MVDSGRPDHSAMPRHRVPLTRRQIVAQVVVSVVILASGIIIGSGGTVLALKDRIIPPFRSPSPEPQPGRDANEAAKRSDWIAERWRSDYGLDDVQVRQAKEMLAKEFAATERLRQDFWKAEQEQRVKFALAMKGILTAEQFVQWESDFKRMVERMQNMRPFDPRRGGRGGPPGDRRDGPPDRRLDPNDHRGGWPPGPPRDPNGPRGDWSRRFKGPDGRRSDWGRDRPRDPNDQHGPRSPELSVDPNGSPGELGEPK